MDTEIFSAASWLRIYVSLPKPFRKSVTLQAYHSFVFCCFLFFYNDVHGVQIARAAIGRALQSSPVYRDMWRRQRLIRDMNCNELGSILLVFGSTWQLVVGCNYSTGTYISPEE